MSRTKRNNYQLSYEQFISSTCYLADLIEFFGWNERTLHKRLDSIGLEKKKRSQCFSSEQVQFIFKSLGIDKSIFISIQSDSFKRYRERLKKRILKSLNTTQS